MINKDHRRRSGGDYKVRRAQRGRLHTVFVKSHVNPDDPLVKKGCTTKKKYPTKQRVSAAAKGSERRTGLEHDWYHCHYCGFYHITRVKNKEGQFIQL